MGDTKFPISPKEEYIVLAGSLDINHHFQTKIEMQPIREIKNNQKKNEMQPIREIKNNQKIPFVSNKPEHITFRKANGLEYFSAKI
jgi:glutaredoxin 2